MQNKALNFEESHDHMRKWNSNNFAVAHYNDHNYDSNRGF